MNEVLFATVPTAVLSILTFIFTKRKYSAETATSELDNVEKAAKIWRELSEDLRARFIADIATLRDENSSMKVQFQLVLDENNSLKSQMASLERKLKEAWSANKQLLCELKKFNKNYNVDFKLDKS